MDLWVVAAATGAGYTVRHWQSVEKDTIQSGQMQDQIAPLPNPSHEGVDRTVALDEDFYFKVSGDGDMSVSSENYGDHNLLRFASDLGERDEVVCGSTRPIRQTSLNSRCRRSYGKFARPWRRCIASRLSARYPQTREDTDTVDALAGQSTLASRPLLAIDGTRGISRAREHLKPGTTSMSGCGDDEGRATRGPRLPYRSTASRRKSPCPAGTPDGNLSFLLGMSLTIMSTSLAQKNEIAILDERLKQTESLVQALQEELARKDSLLMVKELVECDSLSKPELTEVPEIGGSPHKLVEEMMSGIEAELEAELELLERNIEKTTYDFDELDPKYEADYAMGEPKPQSDSYSHSSEASSSHLVGISNYAVSPKELSLRLHEVIQSRLQSRVMKLETALQHSHAKMHSLEYDLDNLKWTGGSKCNTSSIDQPQVMNLSEAAPDYAYSEAHGESFKMTKNHTPCSSDMEGDSDHYNIKSNKFNDSRTEDDDELGNLLTKHLVEKARLASPIYQKAMQMLHAIDQQH